MDDLTQTEKTDFVSISAVYWYTVNVIVDLYVNRRWTIDKFYWVSSLFVLLILILTLTLKLFYLYRMFGQTEYLEWVLHPVQYYFTDIKIFTWNVEENGVSRVALIVVVRNLTVNSDIDVRNSLIIYGVWKDRVVKIRLMTQWWIFHWYLCFQLGMAGGGKWSSSRKSQSLTSELTNCLNVGSAQVGFKSLK